MLLHSEVAHNNRFNLFDEIFIKDNHISASQNIFDLVQNALRLNRSGKIITVEVDNLTQLEAIQALNFNRLLLDNMKPDEIKKALNMIGNKYETEASGIHLLANFWHLPGMLV